MATWTGTTPYATKKQLVSSISGLYDDLQDFQFSTITSVSTLTATEWISVPVLYVSSIVGATIDISGITISKDGILDAPIVSLSSLNFKGFDKLLDLDISFDLGLGDAIGGALGGLGAAVGGALIAVGTGAGLAVSGAAQGLATMVAGRPENFVSQTNYETINFTTQLQVSTLGNAYPLYSSIKREVSSIAADQVPGREIFTSTFFTPGTTCIRAMSDPFNLISGNSNLNTSTIQSFGQWVPLPTSDDTPNFSTLTILGSNIDTGQSPLTIQTYGTAFSPYQISIDTTTDPVTQSFAAPINPLDIAQSASNNSFYQRSLFPLNLDFISTPYIQFQSTLTNTTPVYFLRSSISTPAEITYSNITIGGNIAIAEPDETGFRSTATFDFIAQGQEIFIQWGLGVDNLNSTIAAGTAKRVSWDIPGGYSNFIDIPPVPSTIVTTLETEFAFQSKPNEIVFAAFGLTNPIPLAFNVNSATFGATTTFSNQTSYPYQFNGNTFINGVLEAQTIIALSSIFATSTFVDTQISTASIIADIAEFTEMVSESGYISQGYISTLKASSNWQNDYISMKSRVLMMGWATPLSIVTGKGTNFYDTSARFEFNTDTSPQAIFLESQPNNNTLMSIFSTNINIPNLTVENLTANNIVYSNADVPNLQTSTITFGWTGNFASPTIPPKFSMSQSLTTEPGLVWNNYQAASNQTLNIMAFSNTVNMVAQQFSTPLTLLNTSFSGQDIQGWASTIFYNAQATTCRVNLVSGAGKGELSLQGQTNGILVNLNTPSVSGLPTNVPIGSTYKFTCDGTTWTTTSNAPIPGTIQYNNAFQMTMDFENVNISTTDTLNINAEKINLNGIVTIPNTQFSNIYVNNFVSANQIYLNSDPVVDSAVNILREYTGSYNSQGIANPMNITNTINSTDFLTNRATVNPNRGANMFNSYNVNEWNNTLFIIDTTAGSGIPIMILGDVIIKSPSFSPYTGQFFINNNVDSPGSSIPLRVNREGYLSTIGAAAPNQYARVYTNDGTNWLIQSNVTNPQGAGGYTFSNFYTMQMTNAITQINVGQPLVEITSSRTMTTNKLILDCPQVRVYTIESASFPSKESGFEFNSYFDGNVIFGEDNPTQSSAVNPILNSLSNYYYSVAGWSPQIWISRIRTENTLQGYDIDAIVQMVTGTLGDFIWASARFLNVALQPAGDASIRENYFMTPKNYHTSFGWLGT